MKGTGPPPLPEGYAKRGVLGSNWWMWLVVVVVGCLVLLSPIILSANFFSSVVSENRHLLAECEKRGEPVISDGLRDLYPDIPVEQNAAPGLVESWNGLDPDFWREFAEHGVSGRVSPATRLRSTNAPFFSDQLRAASFRRTWQDRVEEPEPQVDEDSPDGGDTRPLVEIRVLDADTLRAARQFLEENRERITAAKSALALPGCRFPLRFEDGHSMLLPHLSQMKETALLFRLEALVAAESGEVEPALSAFESLGRITRHTASEPIHISQLVAAAVHSISASTLEEMLSRLSLSENQLARVSSGFDWYSGQRLLRSAIISERAQNVGTYSKLSAAMSALPPDEQTNPEAVRRGVGILSAIGYKQWDLNLMLKTYRRAADICDHMDEETDQKWEQLFREAEADAGRFPPRIFSSLMLSGMSRSARRAMQLDAMKIAVLLTIEFERHRLRHGRWPQTIEELDLPPDSKVATDPFTGGPMKVRQLKHGFVIYSLGPDRTDEGGRGMLKPSSSAPYDIAFTLERKDSAG